MIIKQKRFKINAFKIINQFFNESSCIVYNIMCLVICSRKEHPLMRVRRLDHIVLTVSNIPQATRFYHEVFDMPVIEDQTDENVTTLRCGHQLIRLQKTDRPTELKADHPTIGAADLCIVVGDDINDVENHLKSYFVNIVEGPEKKMGSEGEMTSIYITDPDNNLVEIASYKK